jgi:glycolate oxidase
MNSILEIDEENLMAVVEPGVLIVDLHAETEKLGLLYPPDPGQESGSLGGNISTNAGGVRGMKYGVTRDFVHGLEAVLPSGEVITMGGKTVKNSTAYSLLDLIIGSEGTLAVVTKATLRLVPKPRHTALVFVPFDSTRDAANTVSEIVRRKVVPYALEYMPRHAVETAQRYLERKLPDAYVADTAAKQEQLWEGRKCLFDAYKAFWEIDEVDACVPRKHIPDYIEGAEAAAERHGVIISNVGHAGDGNVHSIIAQGELDEETWKEVLDVVIGELIDLALSLGGTISGEHGLGLAKKRYLPRQVEEAQIELMRGIKRVFDPHNILNPGKVFDL